MPTVHVLAETISRSEAEGEGEQNPQIPFAVSDASGDVQSSRGDDWAAREGRIEKVD